MKATHRHCSDCPDSIHLWWAWAPEPKSIQQGSSKRRPRSSRRKPMHKPLFFAWEHPGTTQWRLQSMLACFLFTSWQTVLHTFYSDDGYALCEWLRFEKHAKELAPQTFWPWHEPLWIYYPIDEGEVVNLELHAYGSVDIYRLVGYLNGAYGARLLALVTNIWWRNIYDAQCWTRKASGRGTALQGGDMLTSFANQDNVCGAGGSTDRRRWQWWFYWSPVTFLFG